MYEYFDSLIPYKAMRLQKAHDICIKKTVCSGTSLLWTPWGPSKVSCIERCPHFRGKCLLRKHIWDLAKCS